MIQGKKILDGEEKAVILGHHIHLASSSGSGEKFQKLKA